VLPLENGLVVYELAALRINDLAAEVLVLKQVEKVEAHWVHEVFGIIRLLPVLQILQVVDERLVLKKSTLGKDWQGISMVICLLESKGSAEGKQV